MATASLGSSPPRRQQDEFAREYHSDWVLATLTGLLSIGTSLIILGLRAAHWLDRDTAVDLRLIHMGAVAIILGVLWWYRNTPSRTLCGTAFLVIVLPYFMIHRSEDYALAIGGRAGMAWSPFAGPRILMFAVAALSPRPRWLGALVLLGIALDQFAVWEQLDLGSRDANIPREEPALSLFYVIFAWTLYGYRVYHDRADREFAQTRAEVASLRMVTKAFLAVKDLANTPLQSLEVTLSLMERRGGQVSELLPIARRALLRLRELNHLLPVEGTSGASVDPEVLERIRAAPPIRERRPFSSMLPRRDRSCSPAVQSSIAPADELVAVERSQKREDPDRDDRKRDADGAVT